MSVHAANLLRDRIPAVMQRWDDRVRSEIPAANNQDQVVLRNSLAEMLEVMAKILSGETELRTAVRDLALITGHGSERAEIEAYTLEQMIEECQILQEVVFEEMETVIQITARERNVVFRYFGEVIRKAAGEFARVQTGKASAAAEETRQSEERYRILFNSLDEGFCVIEVLFDGADQPVDYRLLEVNPAFERQTGLHDASGKRIREMIPDLEPFWFETYGRIALTGEPARFENEAEALGRWYDVYAFRVGAPEQRRVAVLFTDILSRKQTEAALRESEARLRAIIEEAPLAIAYTGPSGEIIFRNPRFDQLWGRPAHVTTARTYSEVYEGYHLDGRPIASEEWPEARAVLKGEVIENEVYEIVQADGRRITCWFGAAPIRNVSDDIVGGVVVFRDVTEERRIEAALRASQERQAFLLKFSDGLRGSADPIEVQDQALNVLGRHLGASRVAYAEDLGDGETVVLTRNYTDGVPGIEGRYQYADYGDELLRELRAGRAVVRPDIAHDPGLDEAEKAAHDALQLGATLTVPLVKGGRLVAVLAVHYRTAHPFPPEEVALVEEVAERTWAAVERARAEAALRAADRAKSEFLAMLGHELRNPLGAATNALHLVQMQGETLPPLQRPLQVLERQIAQMRRLVDDLLDVTRITQGRVRLEMRPVALDEVVAAALRGHQPAIHEKGLRDDYKGDLGVMVTGDALRLEQVATNLIGNAVKYTDAGSIHVSVRKKNGEAVLRVWDTGIGIAPEALQHVFDLFSQVRTDLARTQGGLGIGLTVVKQIVEQHGGRVRVESRGLGQGSAFTVTLPLASEQPSPSEVDGAATGTDATSTLESQPARQRQALRVLVVDDNKDAAESLVEILETWGHESRAVHDGREALKAILAEVPDVALIDIGLPVLDGYKVAMAIRQQYGADGVTLIAVTGYGQAEDRERAIQAGFDHHVSKPVDLPALERLLGAVPPDSA